MNDLDEKQVTFIGDLHLGASNYRRQNNMSVYDTCTIAQLNLVCKRTESATIVLLGDIFDNPRPPEELQHAFVNLISCVLTYGKDIIIITGNHDWSNSSHSLVTLEALSERVDGLHFASNPTCLETRTGIKFACYPWCPSTSGWEEKDSLPLITSPVDYLIGHFTIKKSKLQKHDGYSVVIEEGVSIGTCQDMLKECQADKFVIGHMHLHQGFNDFEDIIIPGSFNRINFNDKEHEKQIVKLNFGGYGGPDWSCNYDPIRMKLIDSEEDLEKQLAQDDLLINTVVKIDIENASQEFVEQFDERAVRRKIVHDKKALEIASIKVASRKNLARRDMSEKKQKYGGSLESAIKSYIDEAYGNLSPDDKKELFAKALEIV